jgi:antirestriction protein ArdC
MAFSIMSRISRLLAHSLTLFLSELGLPYDPKDQAAYIDTWIKVLKNDKSELHRGAAVASKTRLHSR